MKETPVKTRRKFDETFKREAVQNWLEIALAGLSVASAYSQGTIHLDFHGVSPGEAVAEQFASSGVHFLPVAPGVQPLMTSSAPSFFDPSGATVGYSPVFRIKFDHPITFIRFDVGQAHILSSTEAEWRIGGYDAQGLIGGGRGVIPADTRSTAAVTFSSESEVTSVVVQGFWLIPGEAFSGPLYIDNMTAVVVPEPSTFVLILIGSVVLFLPKRGAEQRPSPSQV